jgi:hypothetical protein
MRKEPVRDECDSMGKRTAFHAMLDSISRHDASPHNELTTLRSILPLKFDQA